MALHDNVELANRRARESQEALPRAISAHYDAKSGHIVIKLSSKLILSFSPYDAQGLENAKPFQLDPIQITPSGFGIHFPKLDADLYVPALLEGFLGSKKWMASRLGHAGGQSRSGPRGRLPEKMENLGEGPKKLLEASPVPPSRTLFAGHGEPVNAKGRRGDGAAKFQVAADFRDVEQDVFQVAGNGDLLHRIGQFPAANPKPARPAGKIARNQVSAKAEEFGHV